MTPQDRESETTVSGHGGDLALAAVQRFGVETLFTLSGGHIFPLLDAANNRGMRIVDVRHEQTAGFAAEGMAKLNRRPGVAALTAGPGVTNGMSAIATAHFNGAPLVVFGGRAPQQRWGMGSLQELDHVPLLAPITKLAETVTSVDSISDRVHNAVLEASTPHRGPVFLDFPLDVIFDLDEQQLGGDVSPPVIEPDSDEIERTAELLAAAERPALIAGSDVYWAGAWEALRNCAEAFRLPVFMNGLGRGCLPADHELAFSRTRGKLRREADLIVVAGTPLDFRLSFGRFGDARVVHMVDHPAQRSKHVDTAAAPAGDLTTIFTQMTDWPGERSSHAEWIDELTTAEAATRATETALLATDSDPIKPARVYGELQRILDGDAIVIGDGGDFVSYAGKYIDSHRPGCWMDPGPYGCLGTGIGYAIAARLTHPDRQVVLLLGDGAAGFSLMDVDSLVRHRLPVAIIVGNNGVWGLEKHPMRMLYGYDVAADLQPKCRYDDVVRALGGAGEIVERAADIAPAVQRALAADVPYLVNIITDPEDIYPRSSNLA